MFEAREAPFIENGTFRDNELLGRGIVEEPALVASGISNKDALLHVRLERLPLVLLNVDIGSTSKNAKIADIWFLLEPLSVWCGVGKRGSGKTVPDIDISSNSKFPERRR